MGGGGKGRVIARWLELLAVAELLWQPEREKEEGGWSRKSLIAMWWLPTGQTLRVADVFNKNKKVNININFHQLHGFSRFHLLAKFSLQAKSS
jgi:hypothetical protein